MNPMSLAYWRKHWRQMLSPYLRMMAPWLLHTRHLREPLPYSLGWLFHTFSKPMLGDAFLVSAGCCCLEEKERGIDGP